MKIAFFGSSKYSVIVARTLNQEKGLELIVTNPDKPSGRKRQISPSQPKKFALENNIPVETFDQLDPKTVDTITKYKPDFLIVSDYGKILPPKLLQLPKYASLNVHHSLLPKYRGPAPAPYAILNGDAKSGITIISMTWDVDAGDILAQKEYVLKKDETTDSLLTQLNTLGAELLPSILDKYAKGKVDVIKQDESKATYTQRISKEDGQIDLTDPPDPKTLNRMIRAYYPWPGVCTRIQTTDHRLQTIKFLPGNLIQPEGKRPLTITQLKNGYSAIYEQIKHLITQEKQP